MALSRNNFDGGTNNTEISVINSGGASGTAFAILTGTGSATNSWKFQASAAVRNSALGAQTVLDATSRYFRGDDPSPASRTGWRRFIQYETAPTGANFVIAQARTAADGLMYGASIRNASQIGCCCITTGTGAVINTASASPAMTAGNGYWVEVVCQVGGANNTAQIDLGIWNADPTTKAQTTLFHSYSTAANQDIGTTSNAGRYRFGGNTTTTGWTVDNTDEVAWGTIAAGWIGQSEIIWQSDDNVGITDSVSTAVTRPLSLSDPVNIVDPFWSVDIDGVQDIAEPVGITDAAIGAIIRPGDAVDPVGITENLTFVFNRPISLSDSVGITDLATGENQGIPGGSVTVNDPTGITDSLVYVLDRASSLSDNVGITDSLTAFIGDTADLSDSVNVSDTLTFTTIKFWAIVDPVNITELFKHSDGTGVEGATDGNTAWLARQYFTDQLSLSGDQAAQLSLRDLERRFLKSELGLPSTSELATSDMLRSWALARLSLSASQAALRTTDELLREYFGGQLGLSMSALVSLSDSDVYTQWLESELGLVT